MGDKSPSKGIGMPVSIDLEGKEGDDGEWAE